MRTLTVLAVVVLVCCSLGAAGVAAQDEPPEDELPDQEPGEQSMDIVVDESGDVVQVVQSIEYDESLYTALATEAEAEGLESVGQLMAVSALEEPEFEDAGTSFDQETDDGYLVTMTFTDVVTEEFGAFESAVEDDQLDITMLLGEAGETAPGEFEVTMETPGDVVETNATSSEEGTATWLLHEDMPEPLSLSADLSEPHEIDDEEPAMPDDAIDLQEDDSITGDDGLQEDDLEGPEEDLEDPEEDDEDGSPGFGVLAVLAALGLALVATRR